MNRATNKFHCDLRHPTKKEMKEYRDRRTIALKVIDWCLEHFEITPDIKLKLGDYKDFKCWGQCYEGEDSPSGENHYIVEIAKDQTLRNFVATVVHEMVHVWQWETNSWDGDGEAEAEHWQYKLTDKLWKEGII